MSQNAVHAVCTVKLNLHVLLTSDEFFLLARIRTGYVKNLARSSLLTSWSIHSRLYGNHRIFTLLISSLVNQSMIFNFLKIPANKLQTTSGSPVWSFIFNVFRSMKIITSPYLLSAPASWLVYWAVPKKLKSILRFRNSVLIMIKHSGQSYRSIHFLRSLCP